MRDEILEFLSKEVGYVYIYVLALEFDQYTKEEIIDALESLEREGFVEFKLDDRGLRTLVRIKQKGKVVKKQVFAGSSGRWLAYGLPSNITDFSFLDVGCWSGHMCDEAMERGADFVVGVDMVPPERNIDFKFVLCDVMSEKFLSLPAFDYVLCAGLLYHVDNPMGLLQRLRMKTRRGLWLETEYMAGDDASMHFCYGSSYDNNPSNWWVPTELCLVQMLETVGFSVKCMEHRTPRRVCYSCEPNDDGMSDKILPRNYQFMPGGRVVK